MEFDESSSYESSSREPSPLCDLAATPSVWKKNLLRCLEGMRSSGKFAASHSYTAYTNPGLRIQGESIPLPLKARDAEHIKSACRQAPFGKGDQTIVDTAVRNTWELDCTQFQTENPAFRQFLATILHTASTGLGLENVTFSPYKLLLYEKGSFFKRHKDSEKVPGMVGTVVICLPSSHEGADVHLSFGGDQCVLHTAPTSAFDLTTLAWFSDVAHEVKELTDGYRLVLTYNIIQTSGAKQSAAFFHAQSQQVKHLLQQWPAVPHIPRVLVYPLDHKYTQASLSLSNVKGRDRAICSSLQAACAEAGFYLFLAQMTHSQDDDEYEEGYGDSPDTVLDCVYSCDGKQVASDVSVDDKSHLNADRFRDRAADSESEGEFTGNEGAPARFRYHDTVVVIAHKDQICSWMNTSRHSSFDSTNSSILEFVSKDLEANGTDTKTREVARHIVSGILSLEPQYTAQVVPSDMIFDAFTCALRLESDELYRRALKKSIGRRDLNAKMLRAVTAHLDDDGPGEADWDKWFGVLASDCALDELDFCLKCAAGMLQSPLLRVSLDQWADKALNARLMSETVLSIGDTRYLLKLMESKVGSDPSWLTTGLALILISRGDSAAIFPVLTAVFEKRAVLGQSLVNAFFESVLTGCQDRIIISGGDLWDHVPVPYGAKTVSDERERRFLALVDQCYTLNLGTLVVQLLDANLKKLADTKHNWGAQTIRRHTVGGFLQPLARMLQAHNVAPTPPLKALFELILRFGFYHHLPGKPQKPRGWAHRLRGCDRGQSCKDCRDLDRFLGSEHDETWRFSAALPRRRHIENQLGSAGLFRLTTEKTRSPYTLVVLKLGREHTQDLEKYARQADELYSWMTPLQGTYARDILGAEAFDELVLFRTLRTQPGLGNVAGTKRPALEPAGASPNASQRPRLGFRPVPATKSPVKFIVLE